MISVDRTKAARKMWILSEGDALLGTCDGDYLTALDAFAANWPRLAGELDALAADYRELVGEPTIVREARSPARAGSPKRGSGLRFRELIGAGKTNAEALAIVRSEFPESKATLSDAAWNRARLQKETAAIKAAVVEEGLLW